LAALVDRELEEVGAQAPHASGRRAAVVELDALAQAADRVVADRPPRHAGSVGLGHLEARVGQPVRELAVVGEQDQPGAVGVQAPDRVQPPRAARSQLDDGGPGVGVARRGDHAPGLVHRVDDALARRAQRLAVERDAARVVDVARRVGDDLPAHADPSRADDVLGGAPGGDAVVGKVLGQAHTLTSMDLEALQRTLDGLGQPRFRAGQVWAWAARGAQGYGEMTNVPAGLREQLATRVPFSTLALEDEAHSRDGTVKALFRTHDGRPVEAVLMRYRDGRHSVCVSSQSGCPLTCTFCATGSMRFGRNLTGSEILDQVLHFRRMEPLDHLVFMGMGEPLMNVDAVLAAARRLPDAGITHRRTTVSTVGWLPGLEAFAACGMPLRLAFSLHAPDDELRSRIMPVNERYPLADVLAACRAHFERTNRTVFIEYVMLAGVNDAPAQARA